MTPKTRMLEIGPGSGLITVAKATAAQYVLAVELNRQAARTTYLNAKQNGLSMKVDVVVGHLLGPLQPCKLFDVIVFNPPYLPADGKTDDPAWTGGLTGREIVQQLLPQIPKVLKMGGHLYLIQSSVSGGERTVEDLKNHGFQIIDVDKLRMGFETLYCVKASLETADPKSGVTQ